MPSPLHQHQMSADGRDGAYLVAACRPQAPAVVHYDAQAFQSGFSHLSGLTHTPHKLGGALVVPSFLILLGQRSYIAVSALGAGVMDSSICHPRCTLPSRSRRSHRLRDKASKITIFGRFGHRLQNIAEAPHNHNCVLSQPNFRAPKHGRRSVGWRYQKTIMRCPK